MAEIRLRGGEVDGLSLSYVVEGRGPAVVLLHGLGGFAQSWRHNIAPLAARATVYALDLPGFGRSAKPRTRYSLAYFAHALHGFLDATGIAQAALVGHSFGGAVAVTYALTHPSRVERLALLGAVVPGFSWELSWRHRFVSMYGLGELVSLCGCAAIYRAAIAGCFHVPDPAEVDFLVSCDYGVRTSPAARAAWLSTTRGLRPELVDRRADYRRAISTLDVPVLLVHGRQDPAVSPAHCAEAAEGFPRGRVRWLDACGHFPHIEHPQVVNAWLHDFLVGRHAPR